MMGVSSGCGLCPWSCSGKVGAYVSDSNSNSGSSCTVASAYSAYSVPQILHAVHLTLCKLHTCGHYKPHKPLTPNAQLLQFLLKLP